MVTDARFASQWERLMGNYLAFADGKTVKLKRDGYGDALRRAQWVDDAILTRGVTEMVDTLAGPLPEIADFYAFLRLAKAGIEDDAEREQRRALPPPVPESDKLPEPPSHSRAAWDRNFAIGVLRARRRATVIAAYRASQEPAQRIGAIPADVFTDRYPMEDEIDAILRELHQAGRLKGTLDAALAWRPVFDTRPEPESDRWPGLHVVQGGRR